jgi:hypothetical protein
MTMASSSSGEELERRREFRLPLTNKSYVKNFNPFSISQVPWKYTFGPRCIWLLALKNILQNVL